MEEDKQDEKIKRLELEIRSTKANALRDGMRDGEKRTAESLFDLVDDCDRALQVLKSDPEAMRAGVEQMRLRAIRRFKDLGFEPFAKVGDDFDPYLHQAVASIEGGESGKIAEVHQRGWRDRDGLVRSAMVSVFSGDEK
jgi:molecular chaperone GrpE